jgi:hypothetical protein
MISSGTTVEYATKRTKTHLMRFERLTREIQSAVIDESWLSEIDNQDSIFPFDVYNWFHGKPRGPRYRPRLHGPETVDSVKTPRPIVARKPIHSKNAGPKGKAGISSDVARRRARTSKKAR